MKQEKEALAEIKTTICQKCSRVHRVLKHAFAAVYFLYVILAGPACMRTCFAINNWQGWSNDEVAY